jgi:cytochrome c-type biogenesis protein CcsB
VAPVEAVLFWITIGGYALAAGGAVVAVVFARERLLRTAVWVTALGTATHTGAIVARYLAQGHLPWSGDYENALFGCWFIVLFTVVVGLRTPALAVFSAATLPLALLLMGFGAMRNPDLGPLDASLKSSWLAVHVIFAWLAFGAYALAMGAGVAYLLKSRPVPGHAVIERLPSPERLEEVVFRYVVLGFIAHAVMIASGSIWARDLWGSYWSWDPVETWSLVTWLIYGLAIHLRVTRGWRGRRLAWLVILAIAGMIITFFGVTLVIETSNHFFNVTG